MRRTDDTGWEGLAGAMYDDFLLPLASERATGNAPEYFARHPEQGVSTYFVAPDLRTMTAADFEPHSGNAESLVDALIAMWRERGESGLEALGVPLSDLAELLAEESADGDGSVDPLCYTLF